MGRRLTSAGRDGECHLTEWAAEEGAKGIWD